MPKPDRTHLADLRGAARMVVDATHGIAEIVETMHRTVQVGPGPLGNAVSDRPRGITGFVYGNVRGGIRLVGQAIDAVLAPVAGLLPEGGSTPGRDAMRAAVNGVYGDYLQRTGNPLAFDMSLHHRGRRVDVANPAGLLQRQGSAGNGKLLLMVHGLCMNDRQWQREGHDHGEALAREHGHVPLYLRYNSGLRIAKNGRAFADLLEALVGHWPSRVTELTIIGHSMGGLVARSACHHGRESGHAWPRHLRKLVFLGTPHHGAPLERGGNGVDVLLDLSPYSAPFARIGKTRSAGITDLRHGSITAGRHRHVPLPRNVKCYALAATRAEGDGVVSERLVGDGLVPLNSALGKHQDANRSLDIPHGRQSVAYGTGHLELLHRREVYTQLRNWLAQKD